MYLYYCHTFIHLFFSTHLLSPIIIPCYTHVALIYRCIYYIDRFTSESFDISRVDESANLADCIALARSLFDELVVVNTGGRNNTVEIAHSLSAKNVQTDWRDDLALARNLALDDATGDQFGKFLEVIGKLESADRDFSIDCVCPRGSDDEVMGSVRLFPRRPDVRWELRVHETILRSCIQANVAVSYLSLRFKHTGYLAQEKLGAKMARNA